MQPGNQLFQQKKMRAIVKNDSVENTEEPKELILAPTQEVVAKLNKPRSQKKSVAASVIPENNYAPLGRTRSLYDDPPSPVLEANTAFTTAVSHSDSRIDNKNRYVMLMTPDGNIIRMSKKLGGLVCCVSGQEQDEECKSQLKVWRKRWSLRSLLHLRATFWISLAW